MNVARTQDGQFVISEVEPPLLELVMGLPGACEPEGSTAAAERLFPEPVAGKESAEIREEWKEYVTPELRHWFENACATVEADLEQFEQSETLTIPADHVDAWLNTLNQARLVLAARFDVTERDMERSISHLLESERDFALFQIHLYGFMQECLIREVDEEGQEG